MEKPQTKARIYALPRNLIDRKEPRAYQTGPIERCDIFHHFEQDLIELPFFVDIYDRSENKKR